MTSLEAKIAKRIARGSKGNRGAKGPRSRVVLLDTGVVTATATGPSSVTLKINGSSVARPGIAYLASYSPTVGDVVRILTVGRDRLVIGKQQP